MKKYIFKIWSQDEYADILFCLDNLEYYVFISSEDRSALEFKKYSITQLNKLIKLFKQKPHTNNYSASSFILTQRQVDLLTFAISKLGEETDLSYDVPQVKLIP